MRTSGRATTFSGATAAITLPDETVATAATGLADVEAGRAMTPATPMLAASIGKTFVAATVLVLESEGRLSRPKLLAEYLECRPWFASLPNADTITIGHLLHHQSGLPDHPHLPAFQAAAAARTAAGDGAFSPYEVLGFIAGQGPLRPWHRLGLQRYRLHPSRAGHLGGDWAVLL